jgi:hypothetical protein
MLHVYRQSIFLVTRISCKIASLRAKLCYFLFSIVCFHKIFKFLIFLQFALEIIAYLHVREVKVIARMYINKVFLVDLPFETHRAFLIYLIYLIYIFIKYF